METDPLIEIFHSLVRYGMIAFPFVLIVLIISVIVRLRKSARKSKYLLTVVSEWRQDDELCIIEEEHIQRPFWKFRVQSISLEDEPVVTIRAGDRVTVFDAREAARQFFNLSLRDRQRNQEEER